MKLKLIAFRLLTLIALAACCASLLDHLLPSPAFCGFKAGCDEVVHSAFGSFLGVPLSAWGLVAFGMFYVLTLFPSTFAPNHSRPQGIPADSTATRCVSEEKPLLTRALAHASGYVSDCTQSGIIGLAAIIAGLGALALILIQAFVLKQFCPLCLITDAAALLLAAVELGISPSKQAPAKPLRPRRWLWAGAAAFAVGGPVIWPLIRPIPPVPEQVKAYWQPGTITVVEVTDFECPYCRDTHTVLADFLEEYGDRLTFVRLVQPMEQHANARHAARAYLCAEGQSRKMAEALFSAEDLSAEQCERLAESLGLDMERYRACVADGTTDQRIDELTNWLDEKDIGGLPVIWVQNQRLLGAQTAESLRAAWSRVEREYHNGYQTSDAGKR